MSTLKNEPAQWQWMKVRGRAGDWSEKIRAAVPMVWISSKNVKCQFPPKSILVKELMLWRGLAHLAQSPSKSWQFRKQTPLPILGGRYVSSQSESLKTTWYEARYRQRSYGSKQKFCSVGQFLAHLILEANIFKNRNPHSHQSCLERVILIFELCYTDDAVLAEKQLITTCTLYMYIRVFLKNTFSKKN